MLMIADDWEQERRREDYLSVFREKDFGSAALNIHDDLQNELTSSIRVLQRRLCTF